MAAAGHPLDRPIWSALTGARQAHLALGDGAALRFDPDHAFFAAARDGSPEALAALAALLPPAGAAGLIEVEPILPPDAEVATFPCIQMTCEGLSRAAGDAALDIADLADGDAPEMIALARLTEPGPFFDRTHRLGDFVGVRREGRLVAMAGERMKPDGFTEVSGVCTHPDWRGRGFAAALMRRVIERILARGETAFLHSYADNVGAIALYESLGFRTRTPITFAAVRRPGASGPSHGYGHD